MRRRATSSHGLRDESEDACENCDGLTADESGDDDDATLIPRSTTDRISGSDARKRMASSRGPARREEPERERGELGAPAEEEEVLEA